MARKRRGKGGAGRDEDPWSRLGDAMRHPLRARLLGVLSERAASPRDLADEVGAPLSNTSYHVRVLRDLRLIEVVSREPVRGALKTSYRLIARHSVDLRAWKELASKLRDASSVMEVQEAIDGVTAAVRLGTFDRRRDRPAATLKMELDEQGWTEVVEIAREAQERMRRAAESAERRAGEAGDGTFPVTISIFGYESAERG
jgi:DNA-binding transcriptional ArsR family regulator